MADNIDINIIPRTDGANSSPTLAGNKQLATATEKALRPLIKGMEKSIRDALVKGIRESAKVNSTGPINPNDKKGFEKLIQELISKMDKNSSALVERLIKQMDKNMSPEDFQRQLKSAVKTQTDRVLEGFAVQAKKYNVNIDPRFRQVASEGVSNAVVKRFSSDLGRIVTQLNIVVNSIKKLTEQTTDASKAAARAYEKRDIVGGVSAAKKGVDALAQAKEVRAEFKELKRLGKELSDNFKSINSDLEQGLKSLRSTVSSRVAIAKQDIQKNPVGASTDIAKALTDRFSQLPGVKENPDLVKKLDALTGSIKTIKGVGEKLDKISVLVSDSVKSKKITPESTKEFLQLIGELKKVADEFKNTPRTQKKVPIEGQKDLIKAISQLDTVADKIFKITDKYSSTPIQVKGAVPIDTKSIKQIEDAVAVAVEKGTKKATESIKTKEISKLKEKPQTKDTTKPDVPPRKTISTKKAFSPEDISKVANDLYKAYSNLVVSVKKKRGDKSTDMLESAFKSGNLQEVRKNASRLPGGDEVRKLTNLMLSMTNGTGIDMKEINSAMSKVSNEFGSVSEGLYDLKKSIRDAIGDFKSTRVGEKRSGVEEKLDSLSKTIEEADKELKDSVDKGAKRAKTQTPKRASESLAKSRIESGVYKTKTVEYPSRLITPDFNVKDIKFSKQAYAKNIIEPMKRNFGGLSTSLDDLQKTIVDSLEKGLPKSNTFNWQIVKKDGDDIGKFFVAAGGAAKEANRKLARYWKLQIADVSGLKKMLKKGESDLTSVPDLVSQAKKSIIKTEIMPKARSQEAMASKVAEWIKSTSAREIKEWGDVTNTYNKERNKRLSAIKKQHKGGAVDAPMIKDVQKSFNDDLRNVFEATYAEGVAQRTLTRRGLVRSLHIPAVRMASTGAPVLETASGSQRAIAKFASYTSGLEKLFEKMESGGVPVAKRSDIAPLIREVGIHPSTPGELNKANEVATNMLQELSKVGKLPIDFLSSQYKEAAVMKGTQLKKSGVIESVPNYVEEVGKTFEKFKNGPVDELVSEMDKLGVSAYDFAKSMDTIKFENIYDIYKKVLKGPLESLSKRPNESAVRNFEKAVRQVEQLMPLAPESRPRRAYQQQNVINLRTRASDVYRNITDPNEIRELNSPEAQKSLIKSLNLRFNDMINEAAALSKVPAKEAKGAIKRRQQKLPKELTSLSSLGLPESQAGSIADFKSGKVFAEKGEYDKGVEYLKALGGVGMKFYSEDLTKQAPFGQFQQVGRNIAGTTNAISSNASMIRGMPGSKVAGITTEFPTLRSAHENALISTGRFGSQGYGFNVLTEFKHSANTFEDQIVVSGRLAKALTAIVRNLVVPSPKGRLYTRGSDMEEVVGPLSSAVEDLQKKLVADLPMEKRIGEVSKVFQKVLGVEQKYQGRADKALISEIKDALSVVRGEDVNVQTAKLAEVFLGHFGRKLTTRYGSKGVSIASEAGPDKGDYMSSLKSVLSQYAKEGTKIKVLPSNEVAKGAGLGTAMMPKSMGELVSEMIDKNKDKLISAGHFKSPQAVAGLKRSLIESGNKFILDMFKDTSKGLVGEKEAKKQQRIFDNFTKAMEDIYGDKGKISSGLGGISKLKDLYSKKTGGALYKEIPIDVIISSKGIGKRGLQPELLEAVMNNIIGSKGGSTVIKSDFEKNKLYEKLLGKKGAPGQLSLISEALGYKSTVPGTLAQKLKDPTKIKALEKELLQKFGGDKPDMAKYAAELEALSNYYVDIIDELGKRRKGLVGKKFLEVVEEPGETKEWTKGKIEGAQKGLKLNIQAYAAYADIFGKNSELMKEFSAKQSIQAKESMEYLKALQASPFKQADNPEIRKRIMENVKTVSLKDIKSFDLSTGSFEPGHERSMQGSVFDLKKFPTAFNVEIPKTSGKMGETEKMYVPGALARSSYPEPLIAGEHGVPTIARRIQHLINMAKLAQEYAELPTKLNKQISELEDELSKMTKAGASTTDMKATTQALDELRAQQSRLMSGEDLVTSQTINKMPGLIVKKVRSARAGGDPAVIQKLQKTFERLLGEPFDATKGSMQGFGNALDKLVGPMADVQKNITLKQAVVKAKKAAAILNKPETLSDEDKAFLDEFRKISSVSKLGRQQNFDIKTRKGLRSTTEKFLLFNKKAAATPTYLDKISENKKAVAEMAKDFGIKSELGLNLEAEYKRRLELLEKAKVDYYKELAEKSLGKKGAVAEVLFTRRVPAQLGKAITATVDKTKELNKFKDFLSGFYKKSEELVGPDLAKQLGSEEEYVSLYKDVSDISAKHNKIIQAYIKKNIPVLKQTELGLPAYAAKNLPVEFTKKYRIEKKGLVSEIPTESQTTTKGSLFDLLSYKRKLEKSRKITTPDKVTGAKGKDVSDDIQKYIDNDLVPYIESVRFPFTGTSSVQPYKPKLLPAIKGHGGVDMTKHILAVPGIPEFGQGGLEEFDKVISTLKDKLAKAKDLREEAYNVGDKDKAGKLTKLIDDLNHAISAVIPKYTAVQQKLDFDGDAIEVHTAITSKARKDIKKHFDSLAKDVDSTSAVFRDAFTYDETLKGATGSKYTLADMTAAFEKKFPSEKGFEFMKKPFLTKDLKYMKPEKQLQVLATQLGGDVDTVLNDIIEKSVIGYGKGGVSNKDILRDELAKVTKTEDAAQYSKALLEAIRKLDASISKKTGNPSKLTEMVTGGLANSLFESKFKDAIEAQLFKIHTGPETEAMTRIQRIAGVRKDYPTGPLASKAGVNFKREAETQMNELLRFALQKGMDVKHAGAGTVAGDITKGLTTGKTGLKDLFKKIGLEGGEGTKDFADLKYFAELNAKAIRGQVGKLTNEEVMKQAQALSGGSTELPENRAALVQIIVDKLGFKGFLEGLQKQIEEEVYKGIIKEVKSSGRNLKGKTPEEYAKNVMANEIAGGGLNLNRYFTKQLTPLYTLRNASATGAGQLSALGEKNFEQFKPALPEGSRFKDKEGKLKDTFEKKQYDKYYRRYKIAAATAQSVREKIGSFGTEGLTGPFADMASSAMDSLHAEQDKINKIVESIDKTSYSKVNKDVGNLANRIINKEGIPDFAKNLFYGKGSLTPGFLKNMEKQVSSLSDLAGMPKLGITERRDVERTAVSKFAPILRKQIPELDENQIKDFSEKLSRKAVALYKLDKAINAFFQKAASGKDLVAMVPSFDYRKSAAATGRPSLEAARSLDSLRRMREAANAELKFGTGKTSIGSSSQDLKESIDRIGGGSGGAGGTGGPGGFALSSGGGAVPVFIVGVAENVGNILFTGGGGQQVTPPSGLVDKGYDVEKLRRLAAKASGGINEAQGSDFGKIFRASAFHGGGPYLGTETTRTPADFDNIARMNRLQQKALTRTMMGVKEGSNNILDSSAILGTGLHSKIEKYMKSIYGDKAEFEKAIEVQNKDIGTITGHIDAVLKEGDKYKKVIDVKTVSKSRVKDIGNAIKSTGSARYEDIKTKVKDYESRRKLEEVASQLNVYLKALGTDMEAEAHFYNRFKPEEGPTIVKFKFDPERYKRDIANIKKAREAIIKSGGKFAKTASLDEIRKAKPEELSGSEEDYLINAGKAYFIDAIKEANASSRKGSAPRKESERARAYAEILRQQNEALRGGRVADRIERLVPPSVTPGVGYDVQYENLRKLHGISKAYQQQGGIELSQFGLKGMHPEIAKALTEIPKTGPTGPEFADLVDKLKSVGAIEGPEVFKAWKLYKIAVGDFYLKEMDKAQKEAEEFKKAGKPSEEQAAYSTFRKRLSQMQGYIKQNLGKPTDIYTQNRRYLYPGLAQGAGVYASPEEIIKNSTGPLGDDPVLMRSFNKIIGDLKGGEKMAPPVVKAREALRSMGKLDKNVVNLLTDAEQLKRVGPDVLEAWDFSKIIGNISRLREALQLFSKAHLTEDYNAPQRKNLELTIKLLSNIENKYSAIADRAKKTSGEWGDIGLLPVPKFETPKIQAAMHETNIQKLRKYFEKPEELGGPKIGERYTYLKKITDDLGNVISNTAVDFKKQGDAVDKLGQKYGVFSEKQRDLIEFGQGYNRTMSSAIGRAARWGAASTIVYGGFRKLTDAVRLMGDVETGMAQIKMVMNTNTTDFGKMEKAAIGMAKGYGVPVKEVLGGMRVFAQQGLKQEDVLDRTRTATLAANVTTLNAKDATEALTAATKVYGKEGQSTVRFLDSWSEVESRHAITAGDMADAIKKSASAAKNAGFTFDQLNGIIAAIGSTTRQSGKEIGTSMRFIFRRLTSAKAPKELAKIGIPVVTGTGELRKGFNVLDDLSKKWNTLSRAQKMNIAQAVGGTRQYNSLLVLMDNWNEALSAIEHSTDSKGSAERRNIEVMKTYQKQLEQVKQTAAETSIQFGKIFLPVAKIGLKGIKGFLEIINSIPSSFKLVAGAAVAMIAYLAKGNKIIQTLVDHFRSGKAAFSGFYNTISKSVKVGLFEALGVGDKKTDPILKNLHTVGDVITDINKKTKGLTLKNFHSSLGKTAFIINEVAKSYNKLLGGTVKGVGSGISKVGSGVKKTGDFISTGFGVSGMVKDLQGFAKRKGFGYKDTIKMMEKDAMEGVAKVEMGAFTIGAELMGQATSLVGTFIKAIGDKIGGLGGAFIKSFAAENTGLVKAIAPLAVTMVAMYPAVKGVTHYFKKMSMSAKDYANSVYASYRTNSEELDSLKGISNEYKHINKLVSEANLARRPDIKKTRMSLDSYKSPLTTMIEVQKKTVDITNKLADKNANYVIGYDKLGNAVIKATGNLEDYIKVLQKVQSNRGLETSLDVVKKYVHDLTETGGFENTKKIWKDLISEVPLVGKQLAKGIKLAPAKILDAATTKLNKLLAAKRKYPLSTAFDADIERLKKKVKKGREVYQETYRGLQSVLKNKLNFTGLSSKEIEKYLSSDVFTKAYEVAVKVEPKFQVKGLKGKVSAVDVQGSEIMKALHPEMKGFLEARKTLSVANLESANIGARTPVEKGKDKGKILARTGDLVTLTSYGEQRLNAAGGQARLSLKKRVDGTMAWYIDYFNTKTKSMTSRLYDVDVQKMTEAIFPTNKVQADLQERIDGLTEFVAGASAGLRGVTEKQFKREFSLGERFYSDIPTSTLLQTSKGFENRPNAAGGLSPFYGELPSKNYFTKIMTEYKDLSTQRSNLIKSLQKRQLSGLGPEASAAAKSTYKEITKINTELKNTQVIVQYMAVLADLNKTFEAGTRTLQENIAMESSRQKIEKETAGYMQGVTKGLDSINLGVRKFSDLSPLQRLLRENPEARATASGIRMDQIRKRAAAENVYSADKALAAINSIENVAKGFGAQLTPEQQKEYVKTVAATSDKGFSTLKIDTKTIAQNTAATVSVLEKVSSGIEELISKFTDPEKAMDRMMEKYNKNVAKGSFAGVGLRLRKWGPVPIGAGVRVALGKNRVKAEFTAGAIQKLTKYSDKMLQRGNIEGVKKAEANINKLSRDLIKYSGGNLAKAKATLMTHNNLFGPNIGPEEMVQRVYKGISPENFFKAFSEEVDKINAKKPDYKINPKYSSIFRPLPLSPDKIFVRNDKTPLKDRSEYKKYLKIQEESKKPLGETAKNILKLHAATVVYSTFQKRASSKTLDVLNEQKKNLENQLKVGAATLNETKKAQIGKRLAATERAIQEEKKSFELARTIQVGAATSGTAMGVARKLGMSSIAQLGVGGTALSVYGAVKLYKTLGNKLPQSLDKLDKKIEETYQERLKKKAAGESTSGADVKLAGLFRTFSSKAKEYAQSKTGVDTEEIAKKTAIELAKVNNMSEEELNKRYEKIRSKAKLQAGGGHPILAAILAGGAATGAGYLAGRDDLDTQIADRSRQAEKQMKALMELEKKYPKAFKRALYRTVGGTETEVTAINKGAKEVTRTVPATSSPQEYKKRVEATIKQNRQLYMDQIKKLSEDESLKKQQLAKDEAIRAKRDQDDLFARELRIRKIQEDTVAKYRFSKATGLKGFVGAAPTAKLDRELPLQQRMYKDATSGVKDALTYSKQLQDDINKTSEYLSRTVAEQATTVKERARERDKLSLYRGALTTTTDEGKRKEYLSRIKNEEAVIASLTATIDTQAESISRFKSKLEETNTVYQQIIDTVAKFTDVSAIMYKLNDSIDRLKVSQAVNQQPGIKSFDEAMSKRLGGSSPFAQQLVLPEFRRRARRVGVDIPGMTTDQFTMKEVDIKNKLAYGNVQGKERQQLLMQLHDIPALKQAYEYQRKQREANKKLADEIQPFKEMATGLETMAQSRKFSPTERSQLSNVKTILDQLIADAGKVKNISEEIKKYQNVPGAEARVKEYIKFQKEGATKTQGIDFKMYSDLNKALNSLHDTFGSTLEEIKKKYYKEDKYEPITTKQDTQIGLLEDIKSNTGGFTSHISDAFNHIRELFTKPDTKDVNVQVQGKNAGGPPKAKQIGGAGYLNSKGKFIGGAGPKIDDHLVITANNGAFATANSEWIINANSAKKLGDPVMDYINRMGDIPLNLAKDKLKRAGVQFAAEGRKTGFLSNIVDVYRRIMNTPSNIKKWIAGDRDSAKNVTAKQAMDNYSKYSGYFGDKLKLYKALNATDPSIKKYASGGPTKSLRDRIAQISGDAALMKRVREEEERRSLETQKRNRAAYAKDPIGFLTPDFLKNKPNLAGAYGAITSVLGVDQIEKAIRLGRPEDYKSAAAVVAGVLAGPEIGGLLGKAGEKILPKLPGFLTKDVALSGTLGKAGKKTISKLSEFFTKNNPLKGALGNEVGAAGPGVDSLVGKSMSFKEGRDLLMSIPDKIDPKSVNIHSQLILGDEATARQIISTLPKNTKHLGSGAEALTFKTPDGKVIRIATNRSVGDTFNRPNIPEMLQSDWHKVIGDFDVEGLPFADTSKVHAGDVQRIHEMLSARKSKYLFHDDARRNLGYVNGKLQIIDPGAVATQEQLDAGFGDAGFAADFLSEDLSSLFGYAHGGKPGFLSNIVDVYRRIMNTPSNIKKWIAGDRDSAKNVTAKQAMDNYSKYSGYFGDKLKLYKALNATDPSIKKYASGGGINTDKEKPVKYYVSGSNGEIRSYTDKDEFRKAVQSRDKILGRESLRSSFPKDYKGTRYYTAGAGQPLSSSTSLEEYNKKRSQMNKSLNLMTRKTMTDEDGNSFEYVTAGYDKGKTSVYGSKGFENNLNSAADEEKIKRRLALSIIGTDKEGSIYGTSGITTLQSNEKQQPYKNFAKGVSNLIEDKDLDKVRTEKFSRIMGPLPTERSGPAYVPGKSYMKQQDTVVAPASEAIRRQTEYERQLLAGKYKGRFEFQPDNKINKDGYARGVKKMPIDPENELASTSLYKAYKKSKQSKVGKYNLRSDELLTQTDGSYDLFMGKSLQGLLDKGYFTQYYSDMKSGDKFTKKLSSLSKNVAKFRELTQRLQDMRNSSSRPWLDPNSDYNRIAKEQRKARDKILLAFFSGNKFRENELMYSYGNKDVMNKFGPQYKLKDLDPQEYVDYYTRALTEEQESFKSTGMGVPGLTPQQIRDIKGTGTSHSIPTLSVSALRKFSKQSKRNREPLYSKYGLPKGAKSEDYFEQIFDALAELNKLNSAKVPKSKAMPVKHSGGLINQTGPYYLEGGEIVVPKKMSTGGKTDFDTALRIAGNKSSGLTDSSLIKDISSKISDAISSAGDDLVKKLSDTKFKPLKIDEESKKIDINTDDAADSFAEKIGSVISSSELKITPPDASAMTAKIDIDTAAIGDTIKKAIESAEIPSVKVEAKLKDNTVELKNNIVKLDKDTVKLEGGSVGADKLDRLADAMNSLTELVYAHGEKTSEVESKMEMLTTDVGNLKNTSLTVDTVKQIAEETVNINVASLTSDINIVNTNSEAVRSRVEQMSGRINYIDEKFEQELGNIKSQTFSYISST